MRCGPRLEGLEWRLLLNGDVPVVEIMPTDPRATEGPAGAIEAAAFTISRNGLTGDALDVTVAFGGTATNGTDYAARPATITIPAGSSATTLTIDPLDDDQDEGTESVVVSLVDAAAYDVGRFTRAGASLFDDEQSGTFGVADLAGELFFAALEDYGTLYALGDGSFLTGDVFAADGVPYTMVDGTYAIAPDGSGTYDLNNGLGESSSGRFALTSSRDVGVGRDDDFAVEAEDLLAFVQATGGPFGLADLAGDWHMAGADFRAEIAIAADGGVSGSVESIDGADSIRAGSNATITDDGRLTVAVAGDDRDDPGTQLVGRLNEAGDVLVLADQDPALDEDARLIIGVKRPERADPDALGGRYDLFGMSDIGAASLVNGGLTATMQSFDGPVDVDGSYRSTPDGGITFNVRVTEAGLTERGVVVGAFNRAGNVLIVTDSRFRGQEDSGLALLVDAVTGGNTVSVRSLDGDAAEEGGDPATFRIERNGTEGDVTVKYRVSGKARSGQDFDPLAGTATIADGQDFVDVVLTPIDDASVEGDEAVTATLLRDRSYTLDADRTRQSAHATIADNEPTLMIEATDGEAGEDGDHASLRITRQGSSAQALTVKLRISGRASLRRGDFTIAGLNADGRTVTIPAGQNSFDLTIEPIDDQDVEGDEDVTVTLSQDRSYTLDADRSRQSASATISDNEPALRIDAIDGLLAENGNDGTLRITRDGSLANDLAVKLRFSGRARLNQDYTVVGLDADGRTVTIPAGAASVDLTIQAIADGRDEGEESLLAALLRDRTYSLDADATRRSAQASIVPLV